MFLLLSWTVGAPPRLELLPLNDLVTTAKILGRVTAEKREFGIYNLDNGSLKRIFPEMATQLNLDIEPAEPK